MIDLFLSCGVALTSALPVSATDSAEPISTEAGSSEVVSEEHLLPDWRGGRSRLSERGVDFSVTYIVETLGNISGGVEQGAIYEGLLKAQVDLDLEKMRLWKSGAVHQMQTLPNNPFQPNL